MRRTSYQADKLSSTNMTQVAAIRAVLLFETGKKEEGLALARRHPTGRQECRRSPQA